MYKVHAYVDGILRIQRRFQHLPRHGDTVRLDDRHYAKVTEVVWCFDEESDEGQRVNLRLESEVQP